MLQISQSAPHTYSGRRKQDVPATRVRLLSTGRGESANWTEWMATNMPLLARTAAKACQRARLRRALITAADAAEGRGILDRLAIFGAHVSAGCRSFDDKEFRWLATHRSDVVRQWAVYAVNDRSRRMSVRERFNKTLPFAADSHMSVRECAWMAFRPYVASDIDRGLELLSQAVDSEQDRVRRFGIEVCRPRSVWGKHIEELKREPERALFLLEKVKRDASRYVRLSVGNWINDASKTRPDWVQELSSNWKADGDHNTEVILKRGLRTLARARGRSRNSPNLAAMSKA
jgi:3-methyladenine DNA glycosylase AlkC